MKKPWFSIVEVVEPRGRSMDDIAQEVARKRRVPLRDMRGVTTRADVVAARWEAIDIISRERPDLSSTVIGQYFNRDPSSVCHARAKMRAAA